MSAKGFIVTLEESWNDEAAGHVAALLSFIGGVASVVPIQDDVDGIMARERFNLEWKKRLYALARGEIG